MWKLFLFLFLHFQVILSSAKTLCPPEQSSALLQFQNSLYLDEGGLCDSYPKTKSWKKNSDCCSWDGISCDTITGHVIGLDLSSSCLSGTIDDNSTLFLLHHLQKLNLADNTFDESYLSPNFGRFKELTHLNLSSTHMIGQIPSEIFHLSELVSLDLSYTILELSVQELSRSGNFNKMLQNLTKLQYLDLDLVDMTSVAPASLVNLSSLISLSLEITYLEGNLPSDIFRLPFLQKLSLSDNKNLTGSLPKSKWTGPLRSLDLSYTSFSGEIPDTIGNLKYLNVLELSHCKFKGSIPPSLGNLTRITYLDLSSNGFTGQVPASISNLVELTSLDLRVNDFSGWFPDVFGNLTKLTHLYLAHNRFSGRLPSSAFRIPRISTLDFSENQFHGQIPLQVSDLPSLQSSYLQNNKLSGPIPNLMFDYVNFTELDLSSNNLSGIVKCDMFSNLRSLETFDFSYNSLLSLAPCDNNNFTLPNLAKFSFSSSNNLTEVPKFLWKAKNLKLLDLSNNRISGQISGRNLELLQNLYYLNLSQNFLTSFVNIPSNSSLQFLDLQSNLLQGLLFDLPTDYMKFFSVSNNKLTGEVPSSFCNLTKIEYLSLSNNSLNGTIPQCLGNSSHELSFLDLKMNNFHGSIPQTIAKSGIQYINLNGNKLEGTLPPSFVNCRNFEVLDVGNNRINDTFPHWLASLPKLQVLILRSNRFHGPIGNFNATSAFPKLQILDLSRNQFTGLLPTRYFENLRSMMQGPIDDELRYMGEGMLYYSMIFTVKGVDMTINHILTVFTALDLSDNLFQGEIPTVLGKFNLLKSLNISHNQLTGHIPSLFQNLTELESLDLSSNKLIGEIPLQLASLTSLAMLNLSYNQLVGPIPQGNQFNTFQNDSFIGNLGLCGLPLSKACGNSEAQEPSGPTIFHEGDDALTWFDWKFAAMGYGSGLVFGFSMAYIVFATRKPQWFVRMVDRKQLTIERRLRGRRKGRRNL